jgi:secondary thiamine-phosphate synthase enzyme
MLKELIYKTTTDIDVIDITGDIENFIGNTNHPKNAVIVHINGSTASVSTIEYEPGLVYDIKEALLSLFPREKNYKHHETWNDGNGYSHVMATIMKPSIVVPIEKNKLVLGTWQQIILMDFDNKPRKRSVILKLLN